MSLLHPFPFGPTTHPSGGRTRSNKLVAQAAPTLAPQAPGGGGGGGDMHPPALAPFYPPPVQGAMLGAVPCWPMAAAGGRPQQLPPPQSHPAPTHVNPAAAALGAPLAALMLAVEQQARHEDGSENCGRAAAATAAAAQAAAATAAMPVGREAKRRATTAAKHGQGGMAAVEPAQPDQAPHAHWYNACPSSPTTSSSSPSASSPTSYGSAAGFSLSVKAAAVASSGVGTGATGAGALGGLPPISQPGRRGRRKGSKDGWNAAGAAALASEEDRVGLLPGVHTANLDKYLPAKEKVQRTRTVLAHMSSDEKTERRKERARKYSQDLRRRQLESIQELLVEARRLNVFQLLVQESADPLLVLAPPTGTVLFANAAAEGVLLGRSGRRPRGSEELLGRGLLGFVRTGDRAEVEAALLRVVEGEGAGKGQPQRVRCRLVPEGGGETVGVELLLREGAQGVVCNGRVL